MWGIFEVRRLEYGTHSQETYTAHREPTLQSAYTHSYHLIFLAGCGFCLLFGIIGFVCFRKINTLFIACLNSTVLVFFGLLYISSAYHNIPFIPSPRPWFYLGTTASFVLSLISILSINITFAMKRNRGKWSIPASVALSLAVWLLYWPIVVIVSILKIAPPYPL
jgi:hypothetical protein